jgi:hypothetical protein
MIIASPGNEFLPAAVLRYQHRFHPLKTSQEYPVIDVSPGKITIATVLPPVCR